MKYCQRIRDLREDRDLNQADIARILGTSQSYYAQYENDKRQLPFDRAIILADFYNVSLDYIAGRTKRKTDVYKDSSININQSHSNNPSVKINK